MFTRTIAALKTSYARGQANRVHQQLLKLDEHLLLDIGVTRNEVRRVMRQR